MDWPTAIFASVGTLCITFIILVSVVLVSDKKKKEQ